ncbi:TrmH family RNA methyltransferase [Sphingomonas baiyangensis]|uniref:rRNA methyltransferase n=1 Tax=Sphingomonas baiyangensis TaxID=2572576 RepID=A0A4U1L1K0_9SPHN|nr:TrmH family RNA methyltransferase [Sphingomonas baiyangensis]TKD50354.1 rRNA methyltransferase [Sphingomonas baiyangensis]
MPFWTYMLRCNDGTYYTGHTDDLESRVAQHHAGTLRGYTHDRRPLELIWSEAFATREEALSAELRVKGWSRAKKEALVAHDWDRLKRFSMPPSERSGRENSASTALGGIPRLRSGRTDEGHLAPPSPAIVLVRPQLGENIGKAARAMLNFGLTEMRLVAPRDGWPNPSAGPAASGADRVLAEARVFDSVADAVADCAHVYATTVRKRGVTKPVVAPDAAAQAIHVGPGRSAILFGPERSGLETDDVALARTILTVPINPEFGSLNLAQAVILVAYEWSKHVALAQPPAVDHDPPAPQADLDGMLDQLDTMLDAAGYFHVPDRAAVTRRMLRTLLTKPGWSAQEVRTVRGILSTLDRPRNRRGAE